ncbi:MAG: ParB/RepB/Spo0J family partition protein [Alphaproteobacteria bacterium]|nr:ParB/RepB/Spo0J family partition protein [Alphaproteobacteria bacterium]MDY4689780.1 ParB/RepB/Spo0J family partition protein [Alphaproteobacteria bacterium]
MNANNKKFGLGRGLEALLGDEDINLDLDSETADVSNLVENTVFKSEKNKVKISDIVPCSFQPRTEFDREALESLAQSIKEKGVLQPLLVRKKNDKYEIIAGERRWRAAQLAGLDEVPVIVKDLNDSETLEIALIENLQRENLSAIEEAEGLNRLMSEYAYTQEIIGKVIGKSRSYIANTLRLLGLPEEIKQLVKENKLSAGHARALIGCENASELANKIVKEGLSVREAEALAANAKGINVKNIAPKQPKPVDRDLEKIMADLEEKLKLKVKINAGKKGKGSITLHYNTPAELSSLLDILEQR